MPVCLIVLIMDIPNILKTCRVKGDVLLYYFSVGWRKEDLLYKAGLEDHKMN